MKNINILFLLILISCKSPLPNETEHCTIPKIKYLSTYIDFRMWKLTDSDIKGFLNSARVFKAKNEEAKLPACYVPILIKGIEIYYSDTIFDEDEKNTIAECSKLFSEVWENDSFLIKEGDSENDICQKLNMAIEK